MDAVSQITFGAMYAQASSKKREKIRQASIIGGLDVFIRSAADPLLALEYHRHFTHSLFFIPFGALVVSLILFYFFKNKLRFREVYAFAIIGYATHGLLDACTSYGTQLFWPFSNYRVSFDIISIIDPLLTLPILVLMLIGAIRKNKRFALVAILYSFVYLGLGAVQNQRVKEAAGELAESRGHDPKYVSAKPSIANLVVWKSVYKHEGRFYVDAIRALTDIKVYPGDSIEELNLKRDFPWLESQSVQARDIERFRWFSQNYLGVHPDNPMVISDVRYSLLPNEIQPLWGIYLDRENQNFHVDYVVTRNVTDQRRKALLLMLKGRELPNESTSQKSQYER